jgi:hypothetical protein
MLTVHVVQVPFNLFYFPDDLVHAAGHLPRMWQHTHGCFHDAGSCRTLVTTYEATQCL